VKIYIAGPMRGHHKFNFPAFDAAKAELEAKGWEVVSPADLDRARGFDEEAFAAENPDWDYKDLPPGSNLNETIKADVAALVECDAIVLIENWGHSAGAIAESYIAYWARIEQFIDVETVPRVPVSQIADILPDEAAARKARPVATGFCDYFPDAMLEVARLSKIGNEQHNPGTPLHWDRSKSGDESDALMRHFLQRGTMDTDGVSHTVKVAWRAMAMLQKELEGSDGVS